MVGERKPDFCIECRKATEYEIRKKACKEMIRDKEYELYLTTAICKECGCEKIGRASCRERVFRAV